jgi:hypothetical protein
MEWDDGILSETTKEALIKAVAQATPTYIMEVFKISLGLCDDLNRTICNYLSGLKQWKRITHYKSWKSLTHPENKGVLGFKDFRIFNQALVCHLTLRLFTKIGILCATTLKARYYPNCWLKDTIFCR